MKLPFFSHRPKLSDDEIKKTMDELRRLRVEVAVMELESELHRSNVRVLRPRGIVGPRIDRPGQLSGQDQ